MKHSTLEAERTGEMAALGRHLLLELYECNKTVLDNVPQIERIMVDVAKAAHATVIDSSFHHFSPFGVSGVVVIAESHLTIHTWPEYGYAAIDVFTCDEELSHEKIKRMLIARFEARRHQSQFILRGILGGKK